MAHVKRLANYRALHLTDSERAQALEASKQAPESEREATYAHLLASKLVELTVSHSTIVVAPEETHERALSMARALEQRLQSDGLDIEGYCKALGTTEEGIVADFEPMALQQIRERTVLLEVAHKERILATDAEYADEVRRLADRYAVPSDKLGEFFAGGEGAQVREDISVSKAAALMATLAAN